MLVFNGLCLSLCPRLLRGSQAVFSRAEDATDQAQLIHSELSGFGAFLLLQQAADGQTTAVTVGPADGQRTHHKDWLAAREHEIKRSNHYLTVDRWKYESTDKWSMYRKAVCTWCNAAAVLNALNVCGQTSSLLTFGSWVSARLSIMEWIRSSRGWGDLGDACDWYEPSVPCKLKENLEEMIFCSHKKRKSFVVTAGRHM